MIHARRVFPRPAVSLLAIVVASSLVAPAFAQPSPETSAQPAAPPPTGRAKLSSDAEALRPLFTAPLTRQFLDAVPCLPDIATRTLYLDNGAKRWLSKREADALDAPARAALKERSVDFYETKHGTPLAYARPVEVLANAKLDPPFPGFDHARIVDFGYGTIGHLKLFAALGAEVTGVEVDSMLTALYSEPGDLTPAADSSCKQGIVTLVEGQFPAGPGVSEKVGTGYDLFISKNTLKNGYIHPARPVDPRMLVHLGIPEEGYVHALYATLKPGGVVLIYNLCPAPAPEDKPYIPWADGRCPFPPALWEKAGFRVVAFDVVDDIPIRTMARALGWDKGGMDVDANLFAWYSVFQRPVE